MDGLLSGTALALSACVVLSLCVCASARAQDPSGPEQGRSPRDSAARFLDHCRAGEYEEAARYLDVAPGQQHRAPELARRLKLVLDAHVWLEMTAISDAPAGDETDELSEGIDRIAGIPSDGSTEPVLLVRRDAEPAWAFSRSTVGRVDAWYGALEHRWLLERLPASLLRPGPGEILWWQWIALPIVLVLAIVLASLLSRSTRALLGRVVSRTAVDWDDALLTNLKGPLTSAWCLGLTYAAVPWLGLYRPAEELIHRVLHGLGFVVFFWGLWRASNVLGAAIAISKFALARPATRSLIPLMTRTLKVVVVALAMVALLAQLGYPVASLVAGLGIGGLAVALAAQKTLENLFGAFSIGADQPFRVGDFVKIEDFVGTVEVLGLRSTRIRTLDRTLITIPNGKLADMRTESFAERDRLRLACTLNLVYGTTARQMRDLLQELERVLRDHPKIWPEYGRRAFQGARRVVARHRDHGVVPDRGLERVPPHPAGGPALVHGGRGEVGLVLCVPDSHGAPRVRTGVRCCSATSPSSPLANATRSTSDIAARPIVVAGWRIGRCGILAACRPSGCVRSASTSCRSRGSFGVCARSYRRTSRHRRHFSSCSMDRTSSATAAATRAVGAPTTRSHGCRAQCAARS
jgi:MscS family membrane protein